MLRVGLNPYGLTYWLGLQGAGTPRANPNGVGLDGFIGMATELGARVVELHNGWLKAMSAEELAALRQRLEKLDLTPVIGSGLVHEPIGSAVGPAKALGAKTIRLALTRVLEGNRNGLGADWPKLVQTVRSGLKDYAAQAAEHGIWLGIEDHQDFTSQELVDFCDESGPNVGITFDMANPFSVGESPIDFTRRIAHKVRHMHLKDYNVQFTDEGIRLVRSAIGDGAVPFREMLDIILPHHENLTATLELAALEARHIRLYRPEWWNGYPPSSGAGLAACLAAARRNRLPDDADYRTPWEKGEDGQALIDYELGQIRRSAENMKKLGIM